MRNVAESEMIGRSAEFEATLEQVDLVAPANCAVLIQGETGTGKELIAQAIHNRSSRSSGPFIKVNCAAIPAGLLESELFGHERGAFTGALMQRIGRLQLAHKGTLFLDEIGDMPLELQPKLLRALQEQEFERLGSSQTQRVDVRVVAATNLNLAQMVGERRFRADLYYRLNVFPITLPALRNRADDIPALVRHFVREFAGRMNKSIEAIPDQAMEMLCAHDWPGNIRELQNFIERAVVMTEGAVLRAPLMEVKPRHSGTQSSMPSSATNKTGQTLVEMEREHITETLLRANWVVGGRTGAAAKLGLPRTTLIARMRRLGISRETLGLGGDGNYRQAFAAAG
jgi:formate hydrogenlyase transcriptional activator